MKLIVGLGNPGKKYEQTRHNSGFLVMDALAHLCHTNIAQNKWNALISQVRIGAEQVILMKPQTFMNESGIAVRQVFDFYKMALEDILVIHDDMDLKVGSLRIRQKGSSGGQKGMKSIQQHLNSQMIARIRVGVGHSEKGVHEKVPDWVLSSVFPEEKAIFQQTIEQAAKACYEWVIEPMDLVMNRFNKKG